MSSTSTKNLEVPGLGFREPEPKKSLFSGARRPNKIKSNILSSKSHSRISSRRSSFRRGTENTHQRTSTRKLSHDTSFEKKKSSGVDTPLNRVRKLEAEQFKKRLSDFNLIPVKKDIIFSKERQSILNEIYSPNMSGFKRKRIQLLDKVNYNFIFDS